MCHVSSIVNYCFRWRFNDRQNEFQGLKENTAVRMIRKIDNFNHVIHPEVTLALNVIDRTSIIEDNLDYDLIHERLPGRLLTMMTVISFGFRSAKLLLLLGLA